MDIVEHIVQIIAQEAGQRSHRPDTDDIHPLGLQDGRHCVAELLPGDGLLGLPELFHIGMEDCGDHVLVLHPVVGYLDPLDGGQPVQDHLLHGLLHAGEAVEAQVHGKADHGGLGDPHHLGQLVGGHESRLVIGFQNVLGDPLLSLGEAGHIFL